MKIFTMPRKLISIINMVVILFIACACNYNNAVNVDRGLDEVISLLEQDTDQSTDILSAANSMKASRKENFTKINKEDRLVGEFNNESTAEAQDWMRNNEQILRRIMDKISLGIEKEISEINKLSKEAYQDKNKKSSLLKYTLTYFKLQYLRSDIRKSLQAIAPLTLIIHSNALTDDTESLDLRKKLEEKVLTMVGIGIVIDQDYNQVKSIIQNFKEDGTLSESLRSVLAKTDSAVMKDMISQNKKLKVSKDQCANNATDENCKKIIESRMTIKSQYEKMTFLFTPGQKYFLVTKILTIIGNLTWGLANTILGAGVVVAAMIASPFTPYVRFPTFRISQSGMQIYVDVTGMSPIPGKMSLGLFELDNASSYGFASHHEGGHAIQSAILGPFYIPTVLVTYLISGFDMGLMENLADSAARASDRWL